MEHLLTVRDVQDILHVDRITVYRMLADNRLTGVKIGGQWRFRESDLNDLLAAPSPNGGAQHGVLPLPCVEAMQDVFAQALGVAVVTVDTSGAPLTPFSHSCAFCDLVLATPAGRQRCQACWADLSHKARGAPQLHTCHAGLRYAKAAIEVDGGPVGLVIAGQIASATAPDELDRRLHGVAEACSIPVQRLTVAYPTVHVLDERETRKLLQIVQTMATAVCRIGHERQKLISRLDRIAAISSEP